MIEFPIYRKLSDNKSYYKIESQKRFTEVKVMGKFYFINTIEAIQFPEIILIQDMIKLEMGSYISIDQDEFESFFEKVKFEFVLKQW